MNHWLYERIYGNVNERIALSFVIEFTNLLMNQKTYQIIDRFTND